MKLEFGLLSVSAVALLCLIAGGIVGGALRKGCIYQACQIDVLHNSISLALELYHADHGSYPTPEQGLSVLLRSDAKGPYLSGDLTDPLGNRFNTLYWTASL